MRGREKSLSSEHEKKKEGERKIEIRQSTRGNQKSIIEVSASAKRPIFSGEKGTR